MNSAASRLNPFVLMLDPEAVISAMEDSRALQGLRQRVCRPLDKPLIPKLFDTARDFDAAIDAVVEHLAHAGDRAADHRHHHSARAFQQMGHGVAVVQITRNESTAVKMHHQGRRMTRLLAAIHAHYHRFTACQIDGAVYTARSGRLRLGRGCCWVGLRGGTRCVGRHGDGL